MHGCEGNLVWDHFVRTRLDPDQGLHGRGCQDGPLQHASRDRQVSTEAEDDLRDVMEQMRRHGVRHLPVAQGDSLEGMISMRDLIHVLLEEADLEAGVLQDAARTAVMARGVA